MKCEQGDEEREREIDRSSKQEWNNERKVDAVMILELNQLHIYEYIMIMTLSMVVVASTQHQSSLAVTLLRFEWH